LKKPQGMAPRLFQDLFSLCQSSECGNRTFDMGKLRHWRGANSIYV